VTRFLIRVPDEAAGRIAHAVLEAVEPGASSHTLTFNPDVSHIYHSRLGVHIQRLDDE
jgi:hypothetical protein